MGHVFISYSHKDTKYAHKLADSLQELEFDIWIDERLDYGSQWPLEIQKQLDTCDAFILIMSPRSFASDWVQSELQRAKRKKKPIFPVLLDGDETWLSVESTQYYDVRDNGLPDKKFYSALKRVVTVGKSATSQEFPGGTVSSRYAGSSTSKLGKGKVFAVLGTMVVVVIGAMFLIFKPHPVPSSPTATRDTVPTSQAPTSLIPAITQTSIPPTYTFIPPSDTPVPPTSTFTLIPPTITPSPPSPIGVWNINANGYPGTLNVISISNGIVSGTVFDNYIEGTWNELSQEITFKRNNSSDPNVFQLFYGTQIKQGKHYILTGSFDDHRTDGSIETAPWTAER